MYLRHTVVRKGGKARTYWRLVRSVRRGRKVVQETVKQVCIALVVTRGGMPLRYEVFAGNRTDVTTVEEIVETMEARYGLATRVWVMDRGMTSAENVAWLQETGRRYLIGTPKSELRKWAQELAEGKDWTTVRAGVEAKLCPGPAGAETFVLCRSVERRAKEKAMHARFSERIEKRLGALGRRIVRARRPLERGPLERQIGRMLERNSRAAGRYTIALVADPAPPAGLRLAWSVRPEWDEWSRHSEGCYVLRTNIADWDTEALWRTYVQLSEAEAAFRIQKSELIVRWRSTSAAPSSGQLARTWVVVQVGARPTALRDQRSSR